MCGIAGILRRERAGDPQDQARLAAAMDRLRHRGPENLGFYADGELRLGHRRLSILDLTPAGNQPMASRDGRLVVSLNGEIYNFIELRAELEGLGHQFRTGTDTEVLLAAFVQWGRDALARMRGMFAFALWDAASRRLLLARDRVGEKPLYYWRDETRFVFASEIRALLELLPRRPELVPERIHEYLHFQYVLEPGTPLDGVVKLPAGHLIEVAAGDWSAEPRRYWNLADVPPRDGEPTDGLRAALASAVELTLRSDAPVAVGLSGGIDSGVIAALAARRRADVSAVTVGYEGAFEHDEREQARGLAERLGIPWHSVELTTAEFAAGFPALVAAIDEPIADVAAYGHFAAARLAAEHGVKVLLTGIGGDELFFGYGWVNEALRLSRLKQHASRNAGGFTRARARALRAILSRPALTNLLLNHRLPAWWRTSVGRALDYGKLDLDHPDEWVFYQLDYHWSPAGEYGRAVYTDAFQRRLSPRSELRFMRGLGAAHGDPQLAISALLFDSWLVANCLALGDRVSMASSVETRMPLLDAALVEAVVGYWKAGRTEDSAGYKLWLRAIAKDVLPREVLDRPKRGFVPPTAAWIAAVNERYAPHLLDGTLAAAQVIDPDRLRRWMHATRPHIRRDFFLYKLILLETWTREVAQA